MFRYEIRSQFERLLSLDSRTKELIASVEKITEDVADVRHAREQLDIFQDEIKGNISSMSNILMGIQKGDATSLPYTKAATPGQSTMYDLKQLSFLQDSYRKAIFKASRQLEAIEREQLITPSSLSSSTARAGRLDDLADTYEASAALTHDMTAYARRLAEEVKLGAMNAEILEDSSTQIGQNLNELKNMGGRIGQSGRLTSLAYRRRLTSYVLFSFAFTFYFLSVATIVLNRIPLGHWLLPSSYF